jgi:GntR family transcriptional regulator / MocR family aminotransferase
MDSGALPPGTALPSTRSLATTLGISRNTVVTAYDELAAEGRVVGRAGSATRVFGRAPARRLPDWRAVLRASQYPTEPVRLTDPDGNALYFHR